MNTKVITRTSILIALLVALQYATASLGQLVTGSCVNLVLAVAALFSGLWSGVIVAAISPFFAFLLGIGPKLILLVPFIALGNVVYVLLLSLLFKRFGKLPQSLLAVACAAVCKFLTLYLVIVKLVLPTLGLPEKQVSVMSASFSWPQLVTATIGGVLALLIVPQLKKAFKEQ
ncbi:MAG: ECF transporter S component [Ruminococcaceae bacterium]|nr:ECF transporter S component [Oscillospiraceae bacterium]